jgi:hypothetical protein
LDEVEAALYSRLSGGTALTALLGGTKIYNGLAPQGTVTPYVVFSQLSGIEENLTPTDSENLVYQVKGISSAGMAAAGSIADAINVLLHEQLLTVTGWGCFWCTRERHIRYEEAESGERVAHAGATYRIRLTK